MAQTIDGTKPVYEMPGGMFADRIDSSKETFTEQMVSKRKVDPNAKMLVTADELVYDYKRDEIAAVGNVQIYYDGAVLEARKVIYDRKSDRLRAEGGVRLKDRDGKVITAENLDLAKDFSDGFVNSLRLDTPDKLHFAAARAERSGGNTTTFQSGVYTACEPCKEHPEKPPLWQVKAAKIVHKESEQTIYFEDARLEFAGVPIAWLPYFSVPDPSVKRKSGFLAPTFLNTSEIGFGVVAPYFWNIAPNYDVTFSPMLTSKQGLLLDGEFRHRLLTGSYSIRAAGIIQQDKDAFYDVTDDGIPDPTPGYRDNRGMVSTHGKFNINTEWYWGWDAWLVSDKTFLSDYNFIDDTVKEEVSQIYLVGQGDRSYFDARAMYFLGLSEYDNQDQLPIVGTVDYSKVLSESIFGGQFSYNFNLTSLTRDEADLRATSAAFVVPEIIQGATNECDLVKVIASGANLRDSCLMRGMAGSYTRLSGEADWRRTFIDSVGQMWTPFVHLQVDVASVQANASDVPWLPDGDQELIRAMPAIGFEYRYPFISVQNWGTQTIEPIAQVIVRPNETDIGLFPNEDAQSLVFDDTNLFEMNKYSGYDRVEGGGRANIGIQYTAQIRGAGQVNALFGQSYQLFGKNSYANPDMANTGDESGLETDVSDYVARIYYAPTKDLALISRFRFDNDDFSMQRFEFEGRATIDRVTLGAIYGYYEAQPDLGYYERREGIFTTGALKLNQNWNLLGGVRYNLQEDEIDYSLVGISYIDECFGISLNYVSDYTESGNRERVDKFLLKISLRTLGEGGFTTNLGSTMTSEE